MKIYILAKIIIEGYYNRYYTPMIDTGAEANICKYNCLLEDKLEKLKTPIVVTGFNNEGSMITYKAKNIKIQIWDKILTIEEIYNFELGSCDVVICLFLILVLQTDKNVIADYLSRQSYSIILIHNN